MYHKITLVGNLGRDPEMRYLQNGTPVTSFSMATSERWNGQDGTPQERTIWWRVSVFGKQAEPVKQYLAKGRKVLVEGQLTGDDKGNPRIWTDNSGQPRASFEVRANAVKFLDPKGGGSSGGSSGGAPADHAGDMGYGPGDEGDIPF